MTKKAKSLPMEIKNNLRNIRWWRGRYCNRILRYVLRNRGIYIVDEDWDNLIILDACRFDVFKQLNSIDGKLESKISRGSSTVDFLTENFRKHPQRVNFKDIIYVTANPYVDLLLPGRFYRIYSVWRHGWDAHLNTVPPQNVVKEALKAYKENIGKRLIVHFMQPHSPFLQFKCYHGTGFEKLRTVAFLKKNNFSPDDVGWWHLIEEGKLDIERVWLAYKENLRIVLHYVRRLVNLLEGKTIITSDHGNLFGERPHILYPFREYGHPSGLRVKQLVEVPWLILDRKDKKRLEEKRIRQRISELKKQGRI